MNTDEISDDLFLPDNNNKPRKQYFKCSDRPLLWFIETSYGYINPRGLLEHVNFIVRLPRAAHGFLKIMRHEDCETGE